MIQFYTEAPCKFSLQQRKRLRKWLERVCLQMDKELLSLSYIFMTDEQLLEVNRQHLDHDYYTDVITFDNSDELNVIEGDIFISIDRVRDNAKQLGEKSSVELHRVMVHGLLHLCGLGDKTEQEQLEMRAAEDRMLRLLLKDSGLKT